MPKKKQTKLCRNSSNFVDFSIWRKHMNEFAETLSELCVENNLNPKQLAKKVKISASTLYNYINGFSMPTLKNLVKLANFFGCTINFLVGLDDVPTKYKFKQTYDKTLFFPRYKQLLEENGTNHNAIKDKIGVSMSNLTKWKNGTIPYLPALIEIAKYFDVSVDFLIGREQ